MTKHLIKSAFWGVLASQLLFQALQAQVVVNINSGNPAFPFPQFLDYGENRKTLASQNAQGVTHAEMEQTMRDAWQIFANSFSYTTDTYAGVKYIKANALCPYDCSEGDGYALLAAAYMGDKTTFDGLWMRTHDLRMVKYPRYKDCIVPNPSYNYGQNAVIDNGDAAADASFDIALALLMAWKQWGPTMGVNDFCGNAISYKTEALHVINGLVELTDRWKVIGDCRRVSGSIGLDGYVKNGNTSNELTDWASANAPECPEFKGPQKSFFDYAAPAYFHAFANVLQQEGQPQWNIDQFKRAEASSDWLMGELLDDSPSTLPLAGQVTLTGTTPVFSNFYLGEDFRNPWRTILNYVWHGDPSTSWDPVLHQVKNVPNAFEKNIALRFADFLKDPTAAPWSNSCDMLPGMGNSLIINGITTLKSDYSITGKQKNELSLNWLQGTASPAAVTSQDIGLMAKIFRQCEIEWDVKTAGDNYLTSNPGYFHGWFRLLGMLMLSGNAHSPLNMMPSANLKVYHKVNKTVVSLGDTVRYTVHFRNYGSVEAGNTVLKLGIPSGMQLLGTDMGGIKSGDSIVWNFNNVQGFKTGMLGGTIDSVQVLFKVGDMPEALKCTQAHIRCANGSGWFSNEFPNKKTSVMERNCVNVVQKEISLVKKTDGKLIPSGQSTRFVIAFENKGKSGWLNGGRAGVQFSFALDQPANSTTATSLPFKLRCFHDADEAYIDHGNYRFSYFMNDPVHNCLGTSGCADGWALLNTISEGNTPASTKLFVEPVTPGADANGSWNQRLVLQFSNQLTTTTAHLARYYGVPSRVHKGGTSPLRVVWGLHTSQYATVNWADDWSWDASLNEGDAGLYYPVGDDFTDVNSIGKPVTKWIRNGCETANRTTKKILIEEWDGYTWRRVYGNGPLPNLPVTNVVITDTLPANVTFTRFEKQNPLGVNAVATVIAGGRTVISWSIPSLALAAKDSIVYTALVQGNCPGTFKKISSKVSLRANGLPIQVNQDSLMVPCGSLTGLSEDVYETAVVFPNPAKNEVYLKGFLAPVSIILKDAQGRSLREEMVQPGSPMLVSDLANGAYFLEFKQNDRVQRTKLMIVR